MNTTTLHTIKRMLAATVVLVASAASAQQLSPLQQYLYYESGYAPPHLASPPTTTTVQQQAYVAYPPTVPLENAAPDGYYEDEGSDVGPSSDTSSLRGLLTSSGM